MNADGIGLVKAQAENKRTRFIWAVVFTPGEHLFFPTETKARDEMKVWKDRQKDDGWEVRSLGGFAYIARRDEDAEYERAIVLHKYDKKTKERLDPAPRPAVKVAVEDTDQKPETVKRPARRPVGV